MALGLLVRGRRPTSRQAFLSRRTPGARRGRRLARPPSTSARVFSSFSADTVRTPLYVAARHVYSLSSSVKVESGCIKPTVSQIPDEAWQQKNTTAATAANSIFIGVRRIHAAIDKVFSCASAYISLISVTMIHLTRLMVSFYALPANLVCCYCRLPVLQHPG